MEPVNDLLLGHQMQSCRNELSLPQKEVTPGYGAGTPFKFDSPL